MTAQALFDELKAQNIRLEPRPNGKLCLAPKDRLTPDLIERVRQHKRALLELLKEVPIAPVGTEEQTMNLKTLARATIEQDATNSREQGDIDQLAGSGGRRPESDAQRMARLDRERNERDGLSGRGYDHDCASPSHRDYLERTSQDCRCLHVQPQLISTPLICDTVRSKIATIEAKARAKGWPVELLYNSDFWDRPRGLAAVLDLEDEVVDVTTDQIVILKMRRNVLRFRRHAS